MKPTTKYLLAICLGALLLRMAFVSQADGPTFHAYETIEQAEHISETGVPLRVDTPHGTYFPLPVFPYLLAFANLFLTDTLTYLLVPNLFAVFAHAALYFLVLELTGKERYALLAAFGSIFVPAYLNATILTASSLSLAIPLVLMITTLFLKLRKTKENRNVLLALFIVLSFTDAIVLVFIPFLILSLLLTTVREARGEIAQQEFAVFAIFFLIWLYVLLYKSFISAFGFHVFSANGLFAPSVTGLSAPLIATQIGVLVFGLALYATYKETAGAHVGIQSVIALALTIACSLWIAAISFPAGLSLFGLVCTALAAIGLAHYRQFTRSLRHQSLTSIAGIVLGVFFVLTSVLPFASEGFRAAQDAAPKSALLAASWIVENTPKDSLLVAPAAYGYFLETKAERPVYLKENAFFYADSPERQARVTAVLASDRSALTEIPAAEYIVSTEASRIPCVNTVYAKEIFIGKVLC